MATYRFSATVIKRSDGRTATASAAYRAGAALHDERLDRVFDYTRRRGVLHAEILVPPTTSDWMRDRARPWNAVEAGERRKDAQLAREILLSLPHELTHEQRLELVREFAGKQFVARGMIADLTIHSPDRKGDQRNHHAHIMLTMREITDGGFGKKARDWNSTEQLEEWRTHWADAVNRALEHYGHQARVDHRALEAQGLDREPEPKIGPVATEMEREGKPSYAGDDRRAVLDRNRRREQLKFERARLRQLELGEIPTVSSQPTPTPSAASQAADNHRQQTDTPAAPETSIRPAQGKSPNLLPEPARPLSRPAWRRYLYALWRTVAKAVNRPGRTDG